MLVVGYFLYLISYFYNMVISILKNSFRNNIGCTFAFGITNIKNLRGELLIGFIRRLVSELR